MESSKSGREREADNYDEFALEVVLKKKITEVGCWMDVWSF
jgi:hypothetical protein